jgi:hypothetical protein
MTAIAPVCPTPKFGRIKRPRNVPSWDQMMLLVGSVFSFGFVGYVLRVEGGEDS